MISAATRVAGGLMRSLVTAVVGAGVRPPHTLLLIYLGLYKFDLLPPPQFCAAGTLLGAVVGLLSGFIHEDGFMQGTLVGAIAGALVSVDLVDSLVTIWWCGDGCSMDTRIRCTVSALRGVMTLADARSGRGDGHGDIFEPSFPVRTSRRRSSPRKLRLQGKPPAPSASMSVIILQLPLLLALSMVFD